MSVISDEHYLPPPPYKEFDEALSENIVKNCDITEYEKTVIYPRCGALPPDPSSAVGKKQVTGPSFWYIQPTVLRSWNRFLCSYTCSRCSLSLDNLVYNLWYFQINYISVLLLVIMTAILIINNCDLNICILSTAVVMLGLCIVHKCGCYLRLLGRHLSLLEEMTAVFMVAVPSYGVLVPGQAPATFIYFLVGFAAVTLVHACVTPVPRTRLEMHKIHDV